MEEREAARWNGKPCQRLMSRKIMFLAPNAAMSPPRCLAGGIMGGGRQGSQVHKCCFAIFGWRSQTDSEVSKHRNNSAPGWWLQTCWLANSAQMCEMCDDRKKSDMEA